MNNIKIEETCNTCEFNFDGICNVDGTQKYTENIINKTNTCEEWEPSLEYFKYAMLNAPRFLREKLNDCTIGVNKFITLFHDYASGIGRPINIFDAIKYIYGISMVDIAVLMDVSFGVVYRAKSVGVPKKRISQFSDVLGISSKLLTNITTSDFEELEEAKICFWSRPNIGKQLNSMPSWKEDLAREISAFHLKCPIDIARKLARVDKVYWSTAMRVNDFTDSEKAMIAFLTRSSKKHIPAIEFSYSLDIACGAHMNATYRNQNVSKSLK